MASEEMSREEKEALLNIRMEQIRKKNAELQKRYEEVKADKQNAEEISDNFQETRRNAPAEEPRVRRIPPKTNERPRERARYNEARPPQKPAAQEQDRKRPQRLNEDDGPPPDPSYSFLADRSREGNSSSAQDRRRDSRRHPGNFGGKDFENVKSTMEHRRSYDKGSPRQPPQSKMEMSMRMTGRERCEYERWRSERSKIENERMGRQRTSSGEWKREWDREKLSRFSDSRNEQENAGPPNRWGSRNRGGGGRGGRGSRHWSDRSQPRPESPEDDDADAFAPRQAPSGPRQIRLDNKSINVSIANDAAAGDQPMTVRRGSDPKRSAGSREYPSSASEDERPRRDRGSGTWRQPRSPPEPSSPQPGADAKPPIVQQVIFEAGCLREPPPRGPSPPLDPDEVRDEVRDDGSWDDEGSWEEATSDNESQHSQEKAESGDKPPTERGADSGAAAEPRESEGVGSTDRESTPDPRESQRVGSESRESTPVGEYQDAELVQHADSLAGYLTTLSIDPAPPAGGVQETAHAGEGRHEAEDSTPTETGATQAEPADLSNGHGPETDFCIDGPGPQKEEVTPSTTGKPEERPMGTGPVGGDGTQAESVPWVASSDAHPHRDEASSGTPAPEEKLEQNSEAPAARDEASSGTPASEAASAAMAGQAPDEAQHEPVHQIRDERNEMETGNAPRDEGESGQ